MVSPKCKKKPIVTRSRPGAARLTLKPAMEFCPMVLSGGTAAMSLSGVWAGRNCGTKIARYTAMVEAHATTMLVLASKVIAAPRAIFGRHRFVECIVVAADSYRISFFVASVLREVWSPMVRLHVLFPSYNFAVGIVRVSPTGFPKALFSSVVCRA